MIVKLSDVIIETENIRIKYRLFQCRS